MNRRPISIADAISMLEDEELVLESASNDDREFTSEEVDSWEQSIDAQLAAS